jgi:hypothetical protein
MTDPASSPIHLSWRVGLTKSETDDAFERLVAFARRHRAVVDEIALFDSITHHLYLPLDVIERRAELFGRRVRALKAAGVPSVGINVLTTIGHINEAWDTMPRLPFQAMVGHDGAVSTGCACPNTPEFRAYARAKYQAMAQAGPDFIWVDDDIRMQHHGVAFGCFCPTCLALFAETAGRPYTRQALVGALQDPAGGAVRQAWVEQNVRTIESLLAEVERAVHAVDPGIATGLMTAGPGWTTYTGQAFGRWFAALKAPKSRPGGGFYSDAARHGLLDKAFDVGRQRASLPPEVTDCQYELENFPYQPLLKSTGSMMNECVMALAAGLNGIAFNALGMWDTWLEEFEPIAERAAGMRPLWERLAAQVAGLPTAGLWPAWTPQLMARRAVRPGEDWFANDPRYQFTRAQVLAEIGLPLGVDQPGDATVLYGRVAEAFDDDELRAMLSGGVLMDSTALEALNARGFWDLTGAVLARRMDNGAMERFTGDPLNGASAGALRDARVEFWGDAKGMADILAPAAPGARVLAMLEDYFRRPMGPCMTAYENALGGRVVVMGYAPWMFVHSSAKRAQLQNVADWITRGRLPVRIEETVTLAPIARLSADRSRGAVVLLNTGLDPIPQATIHIRAAASGARLATTQGEAPLETRPESGGFAVALRDIAPWTASVILIK